MKLETKIDQKGISYKFFPFTGTKNITWDKVKSAEIREYNSLMEFGGYGIRLGSKGTAYNVAGNMGLQVEMKTGKRILFGTQKEEELAKLLKELNIGEA